MQTFPERWQDDLDAKHRDESLAKSGVLHMLQVSFLRLPSHVLFVTRAT